MGNLYYKKNETHKLINEYKKQIDKEIEEFDDQLSAFDERVLRDFIDWLYELQELEIVCRFKDSA